MSSGENCWCSVCTFSRPLAFTLHSELMWNQKFRWDILNAWKHFHIVPQYPLVSLSLRTEKNHWHKQQLGKISIFVYFIIWKGRNRETTWTWRHTLPKQDQRKVLTHPVPKWYWRFSKTLAKNIVKVYPLPEVDVSSCKLANIRWKSHCDPFF